MKETITYGGVKFFRHTDTYEIRKHQTGTIQYYTRIDTGESGMSIQGLANACGVARSALDKLFQTFVFQGIGKQDNTAHNLLNYNEKEDIGESNPTILDGATKSSQNEVSILNNKEKEGATKPHDFYLIEANDAHVIRDIYCERVIYYYAFESHYKKTKAKELYQTLAQHGLRVFIHSKTGYQAELAPQHDDSIRTSIEEQLKRKVEELELQLVKKEEEHQANIKQLQCKVNVLEYVPHLEKTYQAYLHDSVGGTRELLVSGPYPGRVDIATEKLIIEVKRAVDFEKAFGQLLRYRAQLKDTIHANKTYTIFLFGSVTTAEREILECMAQMTNFQLMIYKDLKDYVDEDELEIRKKVIMAA